MRFQTPSVHLSPKECSDLSGQFGVDLKTRRESPGREKQGFFSLPCCPIPQPSVGSRWTRELRVLQVPLSLHRGGRGGECYQLLPPLLSLGFWGVECQGAVGTSVSLGLGPWSPSSTWLSRPVSLPGKRSGLKISWRDSRLSWDMLHTSAGFSGTCSWSG